MVGKEKAEENGKIISLAGERESGIFFLSSSSGIFYFLWGEGKVAVSILRVPHPFPQEKFF